MYKNHMKNYRWFGSWLGELKALGIDVYKRQSTMLHQWMSNKEKRGMMEPHCREDGY